MINNLKKIMTTGRRHIINKDNSGYAVFRTRNWGERNYKSDRQKGQRKMLNQAIRTRLKREATVTIEKELEEWQ